VVYIPDCNELLVNPERYFRTALEFAYDSNELKQSHLKGLRQELVEEEYIALERLSDFCSKRLKRDTAFFIADQANGGTLVGHIDLVPESSNANYKHAWTDLRRQTSENRIGLYCGLDEVSAYRSDFAHC